MIAFTLPNFEKIVFSSSTSHPVPKLLTYREFMTTLSLGPLLALLVFAGAKAEAEAEAGVVTISSSAVNVASSELPAAGAAASDEVGVRQTKVAPQRDHVPRVPMPEVFVVSRDRVAPGF